MVQTLWENSNLVFFIQKLHIQLPQPCNPEILLLGTLTKKSRSHRGSCTLMFIASLYCHNSQDL